MSVPETYPVKPAIAKRAHINSLEEYRKLYERSLKDPDGFWAEQAEIITWFEPWQTVRQGGYDAVDFGWFLGGQLNASYNCLDRHLAQRGDQVALIWAADEEGTYEQITYRQLYQDVCRLANVLKRLGIERGDRVCIYLPMIPQIATAMLACTRIGAVHSVVFAGFSADSLRDRIEDADCRIVITANEGRRGGKHIPLKRITDEAIKNLSTVKHVLVVRRTVEEVPMRPGRDLWMDEQCARERPVCSAERMDAEDPLFILYTSGSTGRPKGVMHTTGGYMVYAALTHKLVFDYQPGDIYCCAADVGWITGHTYIVYGPLANGATTVLFESTPVHPDAGRYWRMVDDLGINIFYTAPTALRALAQRGDTWVKSTQRKSLRVLGTVGEPINPEIWRWYHDVVGEQRCSVVDTWWQTETGGILITPLPGAIATKPGSATLPFFGVQPVVMSEDGKPQQGNDVRGPLCLSAPWPGQARTLWGDHERFKETYFSAYPGYYFTGDGCHRDTEGYYWITGRIDDVLNVSGHRLGTAEIESALVAHDAVAEAAVVGFPHAVKGTGIYAYVSLTEEYASEDPEELTGALKDQVRHVIGPFANPDIIHLAVGLPKTRSGKIMRRILRQIASGEYEGLGDTTTLADPDVVDRLITEHKKRSGPGA